MDYLDVMLKYAAQTGYVVTGTTTVIDIADHCLAQSAPPDPDIADDIAQVHASANKVKNP